MQTKGKVYSHRYSIENSEWLSSKSKGDRHAVNEIIELAMTEMRQEMEGKQTKRRMKCTMK